MTFLVGLDIGGTKISAAAFTQSGHMDTVQTVMTPASYELFLSVCEKLVGDVSAPSSDSAFTVGVSCAGAVNQSEGTIASANIPYLNGKLFVRDLERRLSKTIRIANDMDCMVLAEAIDGAAQGYTCVHGITLSTGVGSGLVVRGQIVTGPNGLSGEIGHIPLPFRDKDDAPLFRCFCGMDDCIEKAVCGAGLTRLYKVISGKDAAPPAISHRALEGEADALRTLDRYFEMVAKAMVVSLHLVDPDIIVLSGGLSRLPQICDEVTKRWGKYCLNKTPKTKLCLAQHGDTACLRGAAFLWRDQT